MKKDKSKKNWFKVQFEKHPYLYTFVIGWPILFYIIDEFIDPNFSDSVVAPFAIFFVLFPPIIFFLWFLKNKSKIKLFYKRKKKTFKKIYYSFGAIFALGAIYLIAVIISIGGLTNFKDRVQWENDVWINNYFNPHYNVCNFVQDSSLRWLGEFNKYEFKRWTQYFDYFEEDELIYISTKDRKKAGSFLPFYKGDPEAQIKLARYYKNNDLYIYNPCKSIRLLLKAAHQGNKTAQEMIAASSFAVGQYGKIEKVKDMNLKNPALAYNYALLLDEKFKNPEALKYLKISSDAGYLLAKEDLLYIYRDNFKMSNCKSIIEISNYLAEQKSFIIFHDVLFANMGRIYSDGQKQIYQCLGNKPNFSQTFSMLENLPHQKKMNKKSSLYRSFYPALFYLNGWGDVKQNHKKAYELFNNCNESRNCIAYLSYMNFKGLGVEKNSEMSLDLAIKLIEETAITSDKEDSSASGAVIPCGDTQYDFILSDSDNEEKKSQYRKTIIACLNKADEEANIKSLENYIKTSMVDNFKNPELFETINYLGKLN